MVIQREIGKKVYERRRKCYGHVMRRGALYNVGKMTMKMEVQGRRKGKEKGLSHKEVHDRGYMRRDDGNVAKSVLNTQIDGSHPREEDLN